MSLANKLGESLNTPGLKPTGYRFEDDGYQLIVETPPLPAEPSSQDLNDLLKSAGYDFEEFEVDPDGPMRVGGSQVTSWKKRDEDGGAIAETVWNKNFRFTLRRKLDRDGVAYRADIDELVKSIRSKKPVKRTGAKTEAGFVVAISDLQLGKRQPHAEGGTEATIARFQAAFLKKIDVIKELKPEHVVLAGLGDVVEGCNGFHSIASQIDLDNREQMRAAAHLYLWAVDLLVGLKFVTKITVSGVGSNHGENRVAKGVTVTDPWRDNKDLQLLDRLAETLRCNPERYGHVQVIEPTNEFPEGVTIPIDGLRLFTHHGHRMFGGKAASATNRLGTIRRWWESAEHNRRVSADMMLVGHGHVLQMDDSERPLWQAPAGDGGSEWFSVSSGSSSPPGLMSFLFGEHADPTGRRVWSRMEIH